MLLDDYLPEFDVRTSYVIRIAASPAMVYASLRTASFDHWGIMQALYAVRKLPSFPSRPHETWRRFRDMVLRQKFSLDEMLSEGFASPGGATRRRTRARHKSVVLACSRRTVRDQSGSIPCTPAPSGTATTVWNFQVGTGLTTPQS